MVPLLGAMGIGSASVIVAALFGPSQVLIRFANMALGTERYPLAVTVLAAVLLPLAALLLAGIGAIDDRGGGLFRCCSAFASGLKSIVQGTLPLALFGRIGYASRLGKMAAVRLVLAATCTVRVGLFARKARTFVRPIRLWLLLVWRGSLLSSR